MINRRGFLISLLAAVGIAKAAPAFTWDKTRIDFFESNEPYIGEFVYIGWDNDLEGIPYHCSNASTGEWLGFSRMDSNGTNVHP